MKRQFAKYSALVTLFLLSLPTVPALSQSTSQVPALQFDIKSPPGLKAFVRLGNSDDGRFQSFAFAGGNATPDQIKIVAPAASPGMADLTELEVEYIKFVLSWDANNTTTIRAYPAPTAAKSTSAGAAAPKPAAAAPPKPAPTTPPASSAKPSAPKPPAASASPPKFVSQQGGSALQLTFSAGSDLRKRIETGLKEEILRTDAYNTIKMAGVVKLKGLTELSVAPITISVTDLGAMSANSPLEKSGQGHFQEPTPSEFGRGPLEILPAEAVAPLIPISPPWPAYPLARLPWIDEIPEARNEHELSDQFEYISDVWDECCWHAFEGPAHFPLPAYNECGGLIPMAGAVIHEGMLFRWRPDGRYDLRFAIETPALPITMRLQFQFRDLKNGQVLTVTVPRISIPRLGEQGLAVEAIHTVHHEGFSAMLADRFGRVALYKRQGAARQGFGLIEAPVSADIVRQ